ncbi:MAG: phosphatase PAP2 family protein [Deltaproteobacteria bacterium]|nr:phosphatase PAP2 family protein [Deltaproteobacteria bacterium]
MDWDVALFHSINGLAGQYPGLDAFMTALADPGYFFIPGFLAVGYWIWQKRVQALAGVVVLAGLIVIVDLFGFQVKKLVARPRPCQVLQEVNKVVGCGSTFSLPSNHAVNTASVGIFFQLLYPKTGWIIWPVVILIGFGRVYVGAHYVTDIVAGWLLGGAFGWTVVSLLGRLSQKRIR